MPLSAVHLEKAFGDTQAVRGVSLDIGACETLALIGASGCGKTTTLKLLNRLIEPDAGEVRLDGLEAHDVPAHEWRRRIGYVIQSGGLFPHLTVFDNIAVTPKLLGWDTPRIETRTHRLLDMVGLAPGEFAARKPDALSGGQAQRVGLARALAGEPQFIL
ncbi:MAG: ATP-binding cassette domain-containing protein, partial [Pseudomonadota bacterium]